MVASCGEESHICMTFLGDNSGHVPTAIKTCKNLMQEFYPGEAYLFLKKIPKAFNVFWCTMNKGETGSCPALSVPEQRTG